MQITIRRPDDFHLHLRDGDVLRHTVADSSLHFGRALIMPNLVPPITSVDAAMAYRQRILACVPENVSFDPKMTLYLRDDMPIDTIKAAAEHPNMIAAKYYPAGATTNSDKGISDIKKIMTLLTAMAEHGLPLCIHGEVTNADVDIFDREAVFIDTILQPLCQQLPQLSIVLEHVSTKAGIDFVLQAPKNVAATITAHHLLWNRNDMLVSGIKPHRYCLPILKTSADQQALINAAISGNPKFFLGTDSAPHSIAKKESACGCAGVYTAPVAMSLYAEIFAEHAALDKLAGFASEFGARFYHLPLNTDTITLSKERWQIPNSYDFGASSVVPCAHGETLQWVVSV